MTVDDWAADTQRQANPTANYNQLPGLRWSALKHITRSPLHYLSATRGEVVQTPAMLFGSALHCALLEPQHFAGQYAAEPDFGDCRKTENRKARDDWRASHTGVQLVTAADMERIKRMVVAVERNPEAVRLLTKPAAVEVTSQWHERGVPCKAKSDLLASDGTLADVKTCAGIDPGVFGNQAARLQYHSQLAFYRRGLVAAGHMVTGCAIIAIEATAPHDVAVYTLSEDDMAAGEMIVDAALEAYVAARESDNWHGVAGPTGIMPLRLPKWAMVDDESADGLDLTE